MDQKTTQQYNDLSSSSDNKFLFWVIIQSENGAGDTFRYA